MRYKAVLFELENTLVPFTEDDLYPHVLDWIARVSDEPLPPLIAICTNQGGVALRYWMERESWGEPGKFPVLPEVEFRLEHIRKDLYGASFSSKYSIAYPWAFVSLAYYSKKAKRWSLYRHPHDRPQIWTDNGQFIDYVDHRHQIVFSDRHDWRKPDCGMIAYAMEFLKLRPKETLMVGDRKEDMMAAAFAGCDYMNSKEFFTNGTD